MGVADLTEGLLPGFLPWTDGLVRGLRFDPNAFNAVGNVYLLLDAIDSGPELASRRKADHQLERLGTATITVRDNSDGAVFPVASNVSGNSYLWNYGVLAPGSYTLIVTNASGSGQSDLQHQQPHRASRSRIPP